jgi:hypothetical protein
MFTSIQCFVIKYSIVNIQEIVKYFTHNWSHIVETCDIANWKEALALILTYASPQEFVPLCGKLFLLFIA